MRQTVLRCQIRRNDPSHRLICPTYVGLINGAILLNAAGRFKETAKPEVVDTRPQW